MKLFKIVYISVGIVLTSLVLFYSMTGLPQKDRELYNAACALGDKTSTEIWPGLRIGEYPAAIRKGASEYVIQGTEISRRKPVLPVIACTAYPVEGVVNVILPCKSEMDSIGQIAEGLSTDTQHFLINRFMLENKKLSDNQYIAIIFHESLHALQLKYFEKQLMDLQNDGDDSAIDELLAESEHDPVISSLYERQAVLLSNLADSINLDIDKKGLRELFNCREAINETFVQRFGVKNAYMIRKYTELTELIEGTARYAEFKTASALSDDGLQLQYLSSLQEMVSGKEKYYRSGLGLCMILDRVSPEWKQGVYSSGSTLADLLVNAAEDF